MPMTSCIMNWSLFLNIWSNRIFLSKESKSLQFVYALDVLHNKLESFICCLMNRSIYIFIWSIRIVCQLWYPTFPNFEMNWFIFPIGESWVVFLIWKELSSALDHHSSSLLTCQRWKNGHLTCYFQAIITH